MKCPKCNNEYTDDFKLCPFCGEEIPEIRVCPKCGFKSNTPGICPKCGETLLTEDELYAKLTRLSNTSEDNILKIEYYDKLIKLNPNKETYYYDKIELLDALKRHEETIEAYNELIKIDKTLFNYNLKAACLNTLGKYDEELECYDEAIEYFEKAMEVNLENDYETGANRESLNSFDINFLKKDILELYQSKTDLLKELGRYEEVLEIYDKLMNENYLSLNKEDNDNWNFIRDIGEVYGNLVKLHPNNEEYLEKNKKYLEKYMSIYQKNPLNKVIDHMNTLIKMDPNYLSFIYGKHKSYRTHITTKKLLEHTKKPYPFMIKQ